VSGRVVALDARLTRQMSIGMKAYVRELVTRLPGLAPDLQFLILSNEMLSVPAGNVRFDRVAAAVASNGGLGEQFFYARQLRTGGADLIHYMSVYAPRQSPQAHVYTIHDLIHLRYPSYFSWKVPPYYRLVVAPVARSARVVLTDASATVADLHDYLGVHPTRVRVVPLGVSEAFTLDDAQRAQRAGSIRSRLGFERPFILYAGNHRPHKNLQTLVRAWQALEVPCDLVITEDGPLGVDDAGHKEGPGQLHLTGTIDVQGLISLYAGCTTAVQPSLYEGFGLSVLEAMACGAPAVVAQTPVLLEVGGDAVDSFPPTDVAALSRTLTRLLSDDRHVNELRRAGRERVRQFTWDATAKATADVYRELLQ
jgi:glycosyltransferase involved in cell wall biosynthesis